MKKSYVVYGLIYFLITLAVSLYSQLDAVSVTHFIIGSIVNVLFFIGVYFCIKNISHSKISSQVIRIICALILLAFVYISYGFASMSGFHSSYCYNLVAKDYFTGKVGIYCNLPPWHTKIIGGEDARQVLLNNCIGRKSEFYINNPNYCDVYKNASINKDWTVGPNP